MKRCFAVILLSVLLAMGTAAAASIDVYPVEGIKLDGDLSDWKGIPETFVPSTLLADAQDIKDDADCSAYFRFGYDANYVYFAARVSDDVYFWSPAKDRNTWKYDAIEVWMNAAQLMFSVNEGEGYAHERRPADGPLKGAEAKIVTVSGGWVAEVKIPVAEVERYIEGKVAKGGTFKLAFGVDDADTVAGTRDGQIYWPEGYRHSYPDTFAVATFK